MTSLGNWHRIVRWREGTTGDIEGSTSSNSMVDTAPRQIGSGGDKVSRTMGGGWVRSVGGLPRRWCLGNTNGGWCCGGRSNGTFPWCCHLTLTGRCQMARRYAMNFQETTVVSCRVTSSHYKFTSLVVYETEITFFSRKLTETKPTTKKPEP